jgi:hypothetical protein
MPKRTKLDVECAVPFATKARLRPAELDAILEIAFLAMVSDGTLVDEEADAFVRMMLRLYGPDVKPARLHAIMNRFADRLGRGQTCRGARCDRAAALAPKLTRKVSREQAYKLAYVMAMSDLRTNDAEFAFDLALRQALRLSPERADELADEATAAVLAPHPHNASGTPVCRGDDNVQGTPRRVAKSKPSKRVAKSKPSKRVAKSKPSRRVVKSKPSKRVAKSKPSKRVSRPARKSRR